MFSKYQSGTASTQTPVSIMTGWNLSETAGSTALINLRDGGVGGTIIQRVTLAANESVGEQYGDNPLTLVTGNVYVEVNSGAVRWNVYGNG